MNLLKADTYSSGYVCLRATREMSVLVARFHYEDRERDGERVLVFEPGVLPAGGYIVIGKDRQPLLLQEPEGSKPKGCGESFRVRVTGVALNMDAVLSSAPADERDACVRILPIQKMMVSGGLIAAQVPSVSFCPGKTHDIGWNIAQSLRRDAEMVSLFLEPQHRQLFSALDW